MYVNTLITLQENLPTYAQPGQHIMGHVTIMSPGWIKCYVQNLKPATNEAKYTFFIFSKAKQQGIRLGELSKQKESKWLVDEVNIENSGLALNDIDGVCIINEVEGNSVDAIAMGFMNGRYIIMPMIDKILRKLYAKKEDTDVTQTVETPKQEKTEASQEKIEAKTESIKEKAEEIAKAVKEKVSSKIESTQDVKSQDVPIQETNVVEAIAEEEQPKEQTITDFIQKVIQKTVKEKEDKVLKETLEDAIELEMIAETLKNDKDTSSKDENKRVVDNVDAILSQTQEIEEIVELSDQEIDTQSDIEESSNASDSTEKPKEEKRGITPEDFLRAITQVNSDQELKEKIAAFGKQLKVISQFATRNNKTPCNEEIKEETIQNIPAPKSPSPLAQPLETIEELIGQEIEPKTEVKDTIEISDTSPRNALKFMQTHTQKKVKGHSSKKDKNKHTNYMDTIDKKIEDIQLRREQEMQGPLE